MMSEDTYNKVDEEEGGKPSVTLGVPEKQPLDLGVHKLVFSGAGLNPYPASGKGPPEAILIVQEEPGLGEGKDDERLSGVRTRLIIASAICIAFIGLEFGGGFLSNSLVIAADAAQLLTVFSTMLVSMLSMELQSQSLHHSRRPIGLGRAEVVVTLVSVMATWVLTSVVLYLALERIIHKDFTLDVDMMLATSAFGVVANLVYVLFTKP